jgi:hypothetical protein
MKKLFLISSIVSLMAISSAAIAEEGNLNKFGVAVGLGVPDGATLGAVIHPLRVARFQLGMGYNGLAPGVHASATLDPIDWVLGPSLTLEGGHYFSGTIPGVAKSPDISYNYVNAHLGLEVGKRNGFRFFLHGGISYLDLSVANVQKSLGTSDSSVYLGNPSYTGMIAPTGKMGVSILF